MTMSPILLHGVDTLKVNVKLLDATTGALLSRQELGGPLLAQLDSWQTDAKERHGPVATSWSFHEARLKMYPNGAPSWKYLLRNDCLEVKLAPRLHLPMVAKLTLQSLYLWKVGDPARCVEEVRAFLREKVCAEEPVYVQVAQGDLCVDLIGLRLPSEWEQVFISHALTKRPIGTSGKDHAYYTGRSLETIIFSGHGNPINGKLYDKTKEIKQHAKEKVWFYDLWRAHGWDGEADVWRMEYAIEREGFHQMGIEGIDEALRNLKRLWAYCSQEWLRMVIPEPDANRTRWATHPLWVDLQHAFDADGDPALDGLGPLVRERKREKNIAQLTAQLAGCATTFAAWHEGNFSTETCIDDLFALIYTNVTECWQQKKVIPQDVIQEKKLLYDQHA